MCGQCGKGPGQRIADRLRKKVMVSSVLRSFPTGEILKNQLIFFSKCTSYFVTGLNFLEDLDFILYFLVAIIFFDILFK